VIDHLAGDLVNPAVDNSDAATRMLFEQIVDFPLYITSGFTMKIYNWYRSVHGGE
jgi:hypothetical protein